MKISHPEAGAIGAEVTDADLTRLESGACGAIRDLVYRHKLVVFRGQSLTPDMYLAFARKLGRPQVYFQPRYHHPDYPEIFVSSNVPENGKKIGVAGTGRYWHTDYQFMDEPLPLVMVYPQKLPSVKRETYYVDMARVYERLPSELRRHVEGARCIHEGRWRYKIAPEDIDRSLLEIYEQMGREVPAVTHPAVIEHPVTRKRSLYVSEGFTTGIVGASHERSREILGRLFEFIARDEHVTTHTYRQGDILLWDNRPLLHMASSVPKGQPSMSYRIGLYDGLPFYVAPAAEPMRALS